RLAAGLVELDLELEVAGGLEHTVHLGDDQVAHLLRAVAPGGLGLERGFVHAQLFAEDLAALDDARFHVDDKLVELDRGGQEALHTRGSAALQVELAEVAGLEAIAVEAGNTGEPVTIDERGGRKSHQQ